MMLSSVVALALAGVQAAPSAPPVLGALPKQTLPERGCAAYLWAVQDQRFVAMVEPTRLRIMLDGKPTDLAAAEAGAGVRWGWPVRRAMRGGHHCDARHDDHAARNIAGRGDRLGRQYPPNQRKSG